jgi:transcriptional regulator with XRE-family HTH domain
MPKKRLPQPDEKDAMVRLAGTIGLLRRAEGLSLRELAEKAGVGHSDLFRLENASTRNPSLFLIKNIAGAFGLTVDELMNFDAKVCPTCKGSGWVKGSKP